MTVTDVRQRHELSADGIRALMQLLAGDSGLRIASARIDGRLVWIKRYDVEPRPLLKRLHAALSPLMPYPFFRSSREVDVDGMIKRELSKGDAFRAAGFGVPEILHRGKAVVVMSDIAATLQERMKRFDRSGQPGGDELLIGAAGALGRAHAAGLCHGRPHLRDMFEMNGTWGFLDFEEEPEAVMPLAAAQARDIWLLFFQIAWHARNDDTCERTLATYCEHAPCAAVGQLGKLVASLRFTIGPLRLMRKIILGGDAQRYLQAMEFLAPALRSPEFLRCKSAERPTARRVSESNAARHPKPACELKLCENQRHPHE